MEYGEKIVLSKDDLLCEHNFGAMVPNFKGWLTCTNYKLVFKPKSDNTQWVDSQVMNQANVKFFFKIPLGYIFSIETEKQAKKTEVCYLEIIAKD